MLDCDPLGVDVVLRCTSSSSSDIVTWYWTQNVGEAGVSGTAILPGNTSDNYKFDTISTNNRQIGFTVNESTLGYYWCEISNAVNVSLRPSTITPVCPPMNSSQQKKCTTEHIKFDLHHTDTECAEEDSPKVFNRPPLPTNCGALTTSVVSTSNSIANPCS